MTKTIHVTKLTKVTKIAKVKEEKKGEILLWSLHFILQTVAILWILLLLPMLAYSITHNEKRVC